MNTWHLLFNYGIKLYIFYLSSLKQDPESLKYELNQKMKIKSKNENYIYLKVYYI